MLGPMEANPRPLPVLLLTTTALLWSSNAHATPARAQALSDSPAFTDDSDFFRYPSELDIAQKAAWIDLGTSISGTVGWNDGDRQAISVSRDSAVSDTLEPTSLTSWRARYTRASGDQGWALGMAWARLAEDELSLSGSWGKGKAETGGSSLSVAGGLTLIGNLGGDPRVGAKVRAQGRQLREATALAWWGEADFRQDEKLALGGGAQFGPRWTSGDLSLALTGGPALSLTVLAGASTQQVELVAPLSTIAFEYRLGGSWAARGSATAELVATTDTGAFIDAMVWAPAIGGMLGVGYRGGPVVIDVAVNPDWVVGGPYLLSGTSRPMFAVLSARADF